MTTPEKTLADLKAGDGVILQPTEGGYQNPRNGTVVRMTPTQVAVQTDMSFKPVYFRLSDGLAVGEMNRQFPRYRLTVA